jgi:hypothetical protein
MVVVRLLLLSTTTMTMLLILLLTTLRPMTILSRTLFLMRITRTATAEA